MKAHIWMVTAVCLAGLGCGGGDPCSRVSPCPNDKAMTPSEITTCRAELDANRNATCFREVLAFQVCVADSIVCTSGGTTDGTLTLTKASNNCKTQIDAATTCCKSNGTSSACK